MKRLFALALLVGCVKAPVALRPMSSDLIDATAAVWSFYGRPPPAPFVEVITNLTCRNSPGTEMLGFGATGVQTNGSCMAGWEPGPMYLQVARIGEQPWHETALSHEEKHADLNMRGIIDIAHVTPGEWEDGDLPTSVGAANRMLTARGE